jgi:predicted enzyme related to lactoylglutathione lyase
MGNWRASPEPRAPRNPPLSEIQVQDVDQTHQHLAKQGVRFLHPPKRYFWGSGAELNDPDGYLIRLWDEVSMREKGNA